MKKRWFIFFQNCRFYSETIIFKTIVFPVLWNDSFFFLKNNLNLVSSLSKTIVFKNDRFAFRFFSLLSKRNERFSKVGNCPSLTIIRRESSNKIEFFSLFSLFVSFFFLFPFTFIHFPFFIFLPCLVKF